MAKEPEQHTEKRSKLNACCDIELDKHIQSGEAFRQHVMLGIPTWQCPICKTTRIMRPVV